MKGSHVFAFFGGAALGAILALLFAPAKGSETRAKIKDGLEDSYETVKREIKKCMPNKVEDEESDE